MRNQLKHVIPFYVLAACLAISLGCTTTVYVVDLTPAETGLRRTFSVEEASGDDRNPRRPSNPEDRERLVAAYGLELEVDDPLPDKLSGVFTGRMPNDVGGFGSYHQLESPFGIASFYSERFRGSLDLTDSLQRRQASLNEAISLIERWATHQWPQRDGEPNHGEEIASWIGTTFRNDLQNLLLVTWTHSAAGEIVQGNADLTKHIPSTYFAYLAQYAAENDYLQWSEIPALFHAFKTENTEATFKIVHQVVSRKLHHATGRDYQENLQIVLNPEQLATSLRAFLKSTDQYNELVSQRKAIAIENETELKDIDPFELVTGPLFVAFVPSFMWGGDQVEVQLHLSDEPDHTNGAWDVESQSVQWNRSLNSGPIPPLAFAVWTEPNRDRQTRLFGETKLNGDQLAMHATWYAGLNAEEGQRWRDVLDAFGKQRELESNRSAEEVFAVVVEAASLSDSPVLMMGVEATKGIW